MEPGTQASWQADPTGRHEHRYWDGQRWTDNVSDDGAASSDPYDDAPTAAAPEAPPAPAATAPTPSDPAAAATASTPAAPSSPTTAIGDPKPSRGTGVGPSLFVGALAVIAVLVVVLIVSNL